MPKQISIVENPFQVFLQPVIEQLDRIEAIVLESNRTKHDRDDPNKRLDAKEAAEHIGLSLQSLYFLCSDEGQRRNPPLPFHKPAKKLVFFRNELDAWLKEKKQRRSDLIPG